MNALNDAIKAVTATTIANFKAREATRAAGGFTEMPVWAEMDKAQEIELSTEAGTVTVICRSATGNCATHTRITYKLNGKRAKTADIVAMFAAPKKEKLFSDSDRRNMSRLLGL